jgi:hypothetical protein
MRLKVRINVNKPLQQSWKVRANEGNYVQILFKYERLGIFCYLCGLLRHTDKNCPKLFEMEHDDGVRGWGETLRPLVNRMGTAATNKYLKDPIPSRPQNASDIGTGSQFAAASNNANFPTTTPAASNFDGRIIAVQKEISAIKSGILIAQKQAIVKSGKQPIGASSAHNSMVLSATPSPADCTNPQHRPVVLGLLAETHAQSQGEDLPSIQAAEMVDSGVELKKRKRVKAASEVQEADNMCIGVEGIETVGTSFGNGINVVMSLHDNPMYDETIVTAGPDDQACREL